MYDFLDRPVTSLDHGGRFLIWSARSWVKAIDETKCPVSIIARAFGNWNMLPGLQPFLRMMALFKRHGLENFQFCALQCNHVSEHEAIMISMVCAIRDAPPKAVRETLELLVEEEAVANIIIALWQLDQTMGAAGIQPGRPCRLPSPASNPRRPLQ
jgi:hypothetical protein